MEADSYVYATCAGVVFVYYNFVGSTDSVNCKFGNSDNMTVILITLDYDIELRIVESSLFQQTNS